MLGTPCLRFNDFVGAKKISVLEELDEKYHLTKGISSKEPEVLYAKIDEILAMPDARKTYQKRRKVMLDEKIDVTRFWVWFLENYPESAATAQKADEGFWKNFR